MSEQQAAPEAKEISQKKQEAKRKKEYEANRKALNDLCEFYPEVFDSKAPKPLKIGIHESVAEDGKLSKTRIRRALNLYVRMRKYIASLTEGADRVTLGGVAAGQVTAEEALHAKEKLAEIDKKRAQRKPAQDKPKGPRKNTRKPTTKTSDKPSIQSKPKPVKKETEPEGNSEERMQAKLAALVNKRSN